MNFVAIDFETANANRESICGVGFAVVKDGVVVQNEFWYIDPQTTFDSFNIMLHGITPEHVKGAPLFPEARKRLFDIIGNLPVVVHYTGFDMSAMRFACDKYKIPYPVFNYGCSYQCARVAISGLINYKLDTVCEHLGISLENHHQADEGYQDPRRLNGKDESEKVRKVKKMLAEGKDVQVIDESDFLRML